MNLLIILCATVVVIVDSEDPTLCNDVAIHAADRYIEVDQNGDTRQSYRVYRDQYYWELIGIPSVPVTVKGPFNVSKDMLPINASTKIMTVGSGPIIGYQYKFYRDKWWRYTNKGKYEDQGVWGDIQSFGFGAIYNDGDLDHKGHPRSIGFYEGGNVSYWITIGKVWGRVEPWKKGGYPFGQFGEKFPRDHSFLTAAMPYEPPQSDTKAKYYVYLFNYDEFCYRPYNGVDGCPDGWTKNKKLFDCPDKKYPDPPSRPMEPEKPEHIEHNTNTGFHREETVNSFNLIAIVLSFMFYYLL